MQLLALDSNQIESSGVSHLSKANWKKLSEGISLCKLYNIEGNNKLGHDSIRAIVRANWPTLKGINLCLTMFT